jgi:hypothetical protein
MFRAGLRDDEASRLDKRLNDLPGPAPGAGEAVESLRNGLARVDEGRGVRAGADDFRAV